MIKIVEIKPIPLDEDAVLKEVWNVENIEAKTELNSIQIDMINKTMVLAKIFDSELLLENAKNFMVLQKSNERKSMKEFVDVVKAKRDDFVNKGKGFFSSMLG